MKTMELYRALQSHAGKINALVVALYHGKITDGEALAGAKTEIEILTKKIEQSKQELVE